MDIKSFVYLLRRLENAIAENLIAKVMGNGKDFFNELRKQISMAQQGNERAGG